MNIVFVNGSPKLGESTSGLLIKYMISKLENQQIEMIQTNKPLTDEQYEKMTHCDALVFAFPLYVDSIPSSLLRVLEELEIRGFAHKMTKVYCICNNGFFEGKQTQIAIEQLAAHIISESSGNDMLLCVNYPRLLWRIQASLLVWLPRAKKNGLHKYDLYRKRI